MLFLDNRLYSTKFLRQHNEIAQTKFVENMKSYKLIYYRTLKECIYITVSCNFSSARKNASFIEEETKVENSDLSQRIYNQIARFSGLYI